ncbi:MAG: putative membrane protein [Halobacteriales archaeon]|jgi:putative membrane protein
MTETQGNLASLSRYIFHAPRWYTSLAYTVGIAAMAGVGAFDSGFLLEDVWQGVFFIGIPTVVAGFLTSGLDRHLGGQLTPNRSSLLALAGELIVVVLLAAAGFVSLLTPLGQNFVFDTLFVGLASILAFRLLVIIAVSGHSAWIAMIPASLQTVVAAVLLFVYSGTMRYLELGGPLLRVEPLLRAYLSRAEQGPKEIASTTAIIPSDFVVFGVLCLIYTGAVVLFLRVIDRPWKRSLGISALDLVGGFIGHVAEGSNELEEFFETIGEEAIVPVTVLAFRRPDGTEKARFVLPMIHPGPMGQIGGGNLPKRVAKGADGLAFPPHATAGHDFNLVTEGEIDTIIDAADRAHDRIEYHDRASESLRVQEGEAKILGQAFGDDVVLVTTFAPNFADDIEYAVGLSAAAEARSGGFEDVLFVDAHNCNDGLTPGDLGHVVPGSRRSFDMMQAAGLAAAGLADAERGPIELGTAWDETDWTPEEGIGPLGVRAAVLDVDGQTTAYVLVDGNNMEPGLRDRIVETLGDRVDESEVMTTDTHIVNTVQSENQVGAEIDVDRLVALIDDLVETALEDREPVTAGLASERAEVTVFGNDRTETLASHANAAVSMGGPFAVVVTLAVLAVSILIFLMTAA